MTFSLEPDRVELAEMVRRSVALLREHEPSEGYYGCFSGGKDSLVIKQLAAESGVKVSWHYNVTTIDPPELVRYIRREHSDVTWVRPKHGNFFRRMEKKGFPTRMRPWCCEEYKESNSPKNETILLGVRAEESPKRARNWMEYQQHNRSKNMAVLPILQWSSDEIWAFIRDRVLIYCGLYDEGFHRLGCVGCPKSNVSNRLAEFARWPRYERLWMRTIRKRWEFRTGTLQRDGRPWFGDARFRCWEEMWEWWVSDKPLPQPLDGPQIDLF